MDDIVNFNFIVILLIVINILVVFSFVRKTSFRNGFVEINHVVLFSVGFFLYWLLPIIIGETRLMTEERFSIWLEFYNSVSPSTKIFYLLACLIAYLSFVSGGVRYFEISSKQITRSNNLSFQLNALNLFWFPGVALALFFALKMQSELFVGYQGRTLGEFSWRGSLAASTVFLLGLAIIYIAKKEEVGSGTISVKDYFFNRYFLSFLIFATLLLTAGGRMYLISGLLIILAFRTVFVEKISLRWISVLVSSVIVLVGVVGVMRIDSSVTLENVVYNVLSEFIYTSLSLISFLGNWQIEILKFPQFLIYDFSSLIPTIFYPNKSELLISPESSGYAIYSPFGALNSFFSFNVNFGLLGTFIVLYCIGLFLSYLRKNRQHLIFKVIYSMISGWMAFTFFRDPFSVSIVKNVFEFSLVAPMIVVFVSHQLSWPARRKMGLKSSLR